MRAAVTWFGGGEWREGVIAVSSGELQLLPNAPIAGLPRLDGVVAGGFTDHHVHLQLVEASRLADSVLGRVIDLGGNPEVLSAAANDSFRSALAALPPDSATFPPHNSGVLTQTRTAGADLAPIDEKSPELCGGQEGEREGEPRIDTARRGVEITFAGAFLTPPGGYPCDRAWAPEGAVREIADADAAERAIIEMKDAGATRIKIASNSTAGPVFSDELLRRILAIAAHHRIPIVAHAEGPGEAQRVVRLGAGRLAHAPFSERLTDAEIIAQAASASWISTLAIHDGDAYDIAVENVRRFHAAGGTVLYGTDMGNGPMPVGFNLREINALRDAGIDAIELLQALDPADPRGPHARLLFFPGQSPEKADPLCARLLTSDDLKV